ncbi:hypothetical protein CKO25_10575 [Thiocapsa imhoffii]|uniref:Glycosyltransferase 2-like domain-containing protein n=1 Tax=Thiocapsa imhoffii TaxID=382777 RepID=A0A9X0WI03_9GAMM|nr:glycosyltransferase [Thiocapsa imhoffii]MBK1645089.1 hypothetical protein [Thiocapsa imhoffii]
MNQPLVSVAIITYNHSKFIGDALRGVKAQVTDFPVEIVIGDDGSTDDTRARCEEFARTYHGTVLISSRKRDHEDRKNYGAVFMQNALATLEECQGKYVALLEGDDRWCDERKLSLQVEFLEKNPEYSMCCHAVEVDFGGSKPCDATQFSCMVPESDPNERDLRGTDCPPHQPATCSIVVRNEVLHGCAQQLRRMPLFDLPIFFLADKKGKIRYIPHVMGVYRMHAGGEWSGGDAIRHYRDLSKACGLMIAGEIYRDETVRQWLLELLSFNLVNAIKRGACDQSVSVKDALQEIIGQNVDLPWSIGSACQALLDTRRQLIETRRSKSFRLGQFLVGAPFRSVFHRWLSH